MSVPWVSFKKYLSFVEIESWWMYWKQYGGLNSYYFNAIYNFPNWKKLGHR